VPAPPEFLALMRRFNQLGRLLPRREDFDVEDDHERAEVEAILLEMRKVEAEIFDFMARARG
jgi:hypothetical protein